MDSALFMIRSDKLLKKHEQLLRELPESDQMLPQAEISGVRAELTGLMDQLPVSGALPGSLLADRINEIKAVFNKHEVSSE